MKSEKNPREELTRLVSKFVSFETSADKPEEIKKCFDFIKKQLKGFVVKEYISNGKRSLVIFIDKNKKRKKFDIILTGHVDVVPARPEDFGARVKKEKIYGRGSVDMKAGVAIAMLLMKKLKPRNVVLILTSDEELGGHEGIGHIIKKGYKANFVIALEPSGEKITTKQKGVIWLKIKAKGKSAHGSEPWLGKNAADSIIKGYLEIKKLFPIINKNSSLARKWQRTYNLGMVKAGSNALNKVPDYAELGLDIRYSEKDNPDKIIESIKQAAKKNFCMVEVSEKEPMLNTNPKERYIKKLAKIGNLALHKEFGASDARFFSTRGIPAVDFGPLGKNIHGKNEYVEIKSMLRVYKILERFIKSL